MIDPVDDFNDMIFNVYQSALSSAFSELGFSFNFQKVKTNLGGLDMVDDFEVTVQKVDHGSDAFALKPSQVYGSLIKSVCTKKRQMYISRINISMVDSTTIFTDRRLCKDFLKKAIKSTVKGYLYKGEPIIGGQFLTISRPGGYSTDFLRNLEDSAGYELRLYSDFYFKSDL